MFRTNSGRPGMPFTHTFPATGAGGPLAPSAPAPLFFRVPVATVAPVDYLRIPPVNECKLSTDTIIMTGVAGAVFAAPTGVGVLGGAVGGVLSGAVIAAHEKRICKIAEKSKRYGL